MSKPQFVYVIYIRATAEAVWKGLVDPELTRQYWMHENISDWKTGSAWTHKRTMRPGQWTLWAKWSRAIHRNASSSAGHSPRTQKIARRLRALPAN